MGKEDGSGTSYVADDIDNDGKRGLRRASLAAAIPGGSGSPAEHAGRGRTARR